MIKFITSEINLRRSLRTVESHVNDMKQTMIDSLALLESWEQQRADEPDVQQRRHMAIQCMQLRLNIDGLQTHLIVAMAMRDSLRESITTSKMLVGELLRTLSLRNLVT